MTNRLSAAHNKSQLITEITKSNFSVVSHSVFPEPWPSILFSCFRKKKHTTSVVSVVSARRAFSCAVDAFFLPGCPLDASSHCSKLDLLLKCKGVSMSVHEAFFLVVSCLSYYQLG